MSPTRDTDNRTKTEELIEEQARREKDEAAKENEAREKKARKDARKKL